MGFLKNIFGSKKKDESNADIEPNNNASSHPADESLKKIRNESLIKCQSSGFKSASSLPINHNHHLRPSIEIAQRLHIIKTLVLWLLVPQENLPDNIILDFIAKNQLDKSMTEDEKTILQSSREDEHLRNNIGWKFENAWPLAWYFGYAPPDVSGQMMDGDQMQEILLKHTCNLNENIEDWLINKPTLTEKEVIKMEDLFYCLHNAVRSAQLGGHTVPQGFHPVTNGGVIHERRHSLTWMLSEGVEWNNTDLST